MEIIAYHKILEEVQAKNALLVAVSKTRSTRSIQSLYDKGHRHFGENRTKELESKAKELPSDIQWHFIGHLQTKKVKNIISHIDWLHSVDNIKLLDEVQSRAVMQNTKVNCLIQFKIAREANKYGFSSVDNFLIELGGRSLSEFTHIEIRGIMGMATYTENAEIIKSEFQHLKELYHELNNKLRLSRFDTISMGMTNDYKIALQLGSNMVRIGSGIFGPRTF